MWRNVIQVLVWGIWLLISMKIFNIDNSWIVAISAGLSTGIGFAMKDILENIYYGISLMAGRIRVGDYVSIDGTRGTVRNISYTSTMIEALDGSIISFQNSQLFTKNYKNLTKNHGYELAVIPVGVAYGSNVAEVKELAAAAVKRIERKNTGRSDLGWKGTFASPPQRAQVAVKNSRGPRVAFLRASRQALQRWGSFWKPRSA